LIARRYKAIMIVILGLLIFGVSMAYIGYHQTVYPLEKAKGYLQRSMSSPAPELMLDYLASAKPFVPKEGNPVWAFPTATTDFGLMQKDIDMIIERLRILSTLPRDSAAFNTGIGDVRGELIILEKQIIEAQPYVYVSFQNVVLSSIWIAVLLMIFTLMKRGKEKLEEYEKLTGGE